MDKHFLELARRATSAGTTVRPSKDVAEGSRVRASSLHKGEQPLTPRVHLRLIEDDGWLQWEASDGLPFDLHGYRSGSASATAKFDAMEMEFERLPPSKITHFLAGQDDRLTPRRGLRRFDPQSRSLVPAEFPAAGRALVFVHGTFSNSENMIAGLLDNTSDPFLAEAVGRYAGNVFTFDHPTLSVGPILNAIDLQRIVQDSSAQIDLVAHSRGGLVARWWCETFDRDARRCDNVILVGSPLAGTSLAAPPNIRQTIQWLTSVSRALQLSSGMIGLAIPVFTIVETLLKVLTSLTSLAAKTPAADAAMAMVPGLFAMSRVGNNPELRRLLVGSGLADERYHAIRSDFEPADDPSWKFWRLFRRERLVDAGADLLFGGSNDLVVDTESMAMLADGQPISADRCLDFGRSHTVNHLNYFFQPETARFLGDRLL